MTLNSRPRHVSGLDLSDRTNSVLSPRGLSLAVVALLAFFFCATGFAQAAGGRASGLKPPVRKPTVSGATRVTRKSPAVTPKAASGRSAAGKGITKGTSRSARGTAISSAPRKSGSRAATRNTRRKGRRVRRAAPVIVVDKTLPTRMAEARLKVSTVKTSRAAADSTRIWLNNNQPHDPHFALFVLPGQELKIRAHVAQGLAQRWEGEGTFGPPAPLTPPAPRVRTGKNGKKLPPTVYEPTGRAFTWRAPQEPGPATLVLKATGPKGNWSEVTRLNVQVMLPADHLVAGRLSGYLIGNYPMPRDMADSTYMPPIAFLRAAVSGRATRVSPNFFLEDFACHEETSGNDRYMALQPRLLPFLEAITQKVRQMTNADVRDPAAPNMQPMASVVAPVVPSTPQPARNSKGGRKERAPKSSLLPSPTFTGALAAAATNLAGAAATNLAGAAPAMAAPAERGSQPDESDSSYTALAFEAPQEPTLSAPATYAASPNLSASVTEALLPGVRTGLPSRAVVAASDNRGGEGGVAPLPLTAEMAEVVSQRPIKVLSGYRTPAYNRTLNTARLSRHQYGDASDIYVDEDNDGRMDDLNHDGVVDGRDAMVLASWIEDLWQRPEFRNCPGGLGIYNGTGSHGPFVHVDMRGFKARWGGNGLRWDDDNLSARDLLYRYGYQLPPAADTADPDDADNEPGDKSDR